MKRILLTWLMERVRSRDRPLGRRFWVFSGVAIASALAVFVGALFVGVWGVQQAIGFVAEAGTDTSAQVENLAANSQSILQNLSARCIPELMNWLSLDNLMKTSVAEGYQLLQNACLTVGSASPPEAAGSI